MKKQNPQFERWQLANEIALEMKKIEVLIMENTELRRQLLSSKNIFTNEKLNELLEKVNSNITELQSALIIEEKTLEDVERQMFQNFSRVVN
ncbi:MAG: hypothetical protein ACOC22_01095 [bacterium]